MKPYSSARDEFQGDAQVMLDANENSLGSAGPATFNRYPDPQQRAVKAELAKMKHVSGGKFSSGTAPMKPSICSCASPAFRVRIAS
ncbi:hypothetical protein [Hymenobacter radiodurans]|uniref:hypothetical protein n=1 Tax=Hymenobacter radiodurans TaxID=2496028 RepID=UPI002939226B|nr:hypothetical protein [Hymenobacter radiodurans]